MSNKVYVTDPAEVFPVKVGENGPSSWPSRTVHDVFKQTVERTPSKAALRYKRNGEWQQFSYSQYYNTTRRFAKAAIKAGLEQHYSVAIQGFNSPEWHMANVGAILAGGIASGVYTTNGPEASQYIVGHCRAQILVLENSAHFQKYTGSNYDADQLKHVKAVVIWNDEKPSIKTEFDVYTWDEFLAFGDSEDDSELESRITSQQAGHCCTLIYTSGTTGFPKAVMISHDNITWTAAVVLSNLDFGDDEHIVSFLPLSHIAAQMVDIHGPMAAGSTVHFAQPDALKGTLVQTLQEARPTIFLGVPRVWEKIEEKMRAVGRANTGLKKIIGDWAKEKGLAGGYAFQRGESMPWGYSVANLLVFNTIKKRLGLDRCRMMATAAAPIAKSTLDYFLSIGIPLCEIYGMSECSGPQTFSVPLQGRIRTGSCGKAFVGSEMKIVEGSGEIIYRGRHIMMGYMFNEEATKDTIDQDGFLHSGDVGKVDDDGFLYITGRIKELIITAGGENIPPVLIEEQIKDRCPIMSNAMLIGDKRKFLTVLVTLKAQLGPEGEQTTNLAPEVIEFVTSNGGTAKTVEEAKEEACVRDAIQTAIDGYNAKAISSAQKVQKFAILPVDFSLEGNELTPSLKLRRRIVMDKYSDVIENFYA